MIENIVLSKLIGESIEMVKKLISEKIKAVNRTNTKRDEEKTASISMLQSEIENTIHAHEKKVVNWSKDISFKDMGESKSLIHVYVHLDFYLSPIKNRVGNRESKRVSLSDLFRRSQNHLIILGQPGAGKTTSLKYLCYMLLNNSEETFLNGVNFPLFIKLSSLNPVKKNGEFQDTVFSALGSALNIAIDSNLESDLQKMLLHSSIMSVLDRLKPLIVMDGFDEIPSFELKEVVIKEIQEISLGLSYARFVLTSRSGDFYYNIENANQYEICPLSDDQIRQFTVKWLGDKSKANKLFLQLKKSPFYDTTIRPLNLAHLTTIFEKYGKLPEKPKSVYRKVVSVLLEEWDSERSVSRASKYSEFEVDRKLEFLSNLSYQFTYDYHKTVFSIYELEHVYLKICGNYNLPHNQEKKVINELETHNGLFLESGFQQYSFAHKSIQEYLTAEYIVGLPNIPGDRKFLLQIPNELALAVAISSNPSLYLHSLITEKLGKNLTHDNFIEVFLDRILLEKPDFAATPETALAFCYIMEAVYGRSRTDEKGGQQYGATMRYIVKLVKNKFIKQSFVKLRKYYDFSTTNKDSGLVQLNRKPQKVLLVGLPDAIFSYAQFHF